MASTCRIRPVDASHLTFPGMELVPNTQEGQHGSMQDSCDTGHGKCSCASLDNNPTLILVPTYQLDDVATRSAVAVIVKHAYSLTSSDIDIVRGRPVMHVIQYHVTSVWLSCDQSNTGTPAVR